MVTACCIRYATADAFFCIQEINIGMVADVGTLQRLPKLVPLGVVKELAYTGRRLTAQRARDYGLVNEVFESQEAMIAAALQCAGEIAAKPPVAIWGTKQVDPLVRDLRRRFAQADGLDPGCDLEQPARASGSHRDEGKARRRVSCLAAAALVSRTLKATGRHQ